MIENVTKGVAFKKIGKVTYEVHSVCSPCAKSTLSNRIKQLINRDSEIQKVS